MNVLTSIVIPALNEQERLGATLRAVAQLGGPVEVIVVDGGSRDRTVSVAGEHGTAVVHSPPGRGQQMRVGAARAAGDVLWFLHADTRPAAGALGAMRAALADPRVAGGNFRVEWDGPSAAARRLTRIYPMLRILGLCYGDSGLFVRREVYDAIGGMRPLPLFEDVDLVRRLKRAGRFAHVDACVETSSRRFEHRNFAAMWAEWTALQLLYWLGVPPARLAAWYGAKSIATPAGGLVESESGPP